MCPKCNSTDVIAFKNKNGRAGIAVGLFFATVNLTRHLCGDCGYSEEWADSPIDISEIRDTYRTDYE